MALEKIEFFGAVDKQGKHKDGKITSHIPAWYLEQHIDELNEEINRYNNSIKNRRIPDQEIPKAREEMKKLKDRRDMILSSKPKLTGKTIDMLNGIYKDLSDQIGDSMFTYSEMQKGLVSGHEEARRMVNPIINVSNECAEILPKLGITPRDGKISRNEASKIVKVIGKLTDQPTNVEYFRKDHNYGTYHPSRPLDEVINS